MNKAKDTECHSESEPPQIKASAEGIPSTSDHGGATSPPNTVTSTSHNPDNEENPTIQDGDTAEIPTRQDTGNSDISTGQNLDDKAKITASENLDKARSSTSHESELSVRPKIINRQKIRIKKRGSRPHAGKGPIPAAEIPNTKNPDTKTDTLIQNPEKTDTSFPYIPEDESLGKFELPPCYTPDKSEIPSSHYTDNPNIQLSSDINPHKGDIVLSPECYNPAYLARRNLFKAVMPTSDSPHRHGFHGPHMTDNPTSHVLYEGDVSTSQDKYKTYSSSSDSLHKAKLTTSQDPYKGEMPVPHDASSSEMQNETFLEKMSKSKKTHKAKFGPSQGSIETHNPEMSTDNKTQLAMPYNAFTPETRHETFIEKILKFKAYKAKMAEAQGIELETHNPETPTGDDPYSKNKLTTSVDNYTLENLMRQNPCKDEIQTLSKMSTPPAAAKSGKSSKRSKSPDAPRPPKPSTSSPPPPAAEQPDTTAKVLDPKDKSCCFCWCCCCSCSCTRDGCRFSLSVHNRMNNRKMHQMTATGDNFFNEPEQQPTVEDIRSWGESFDRLMRCASGRRVFRDFLRCEYSEENILFWLACEDLKRESNPELVEEKARSIYEDYVSILSPKEVSLDSKVREIVNKNMVAPTQSTFDEAQLQIYTLMHRDSYPRFVSSHIYRKMAQLSPPTPPTRKTSISVG